MKNVPLPVRRGFACFVGALVCGQVASAVTYEVGPGKPLEEVEQVPWAGIDEGDKVLIYARAEPYQVKWLISGHGSASAPITVSGVPDAEGHLPIISGINAVTPHGLDYNGVRSLVKIGASAARPGVFPAYIVLENLEIRGARAPYKFFNRKGTAVPYQAIAAPIHIESGNHITIRNCIIHDGANGIFISPSAKNITIERCHIYDNGVEKNSKMHNVYTEADGMIFQFNHFGPLRAGCAGNNIKDRSAGTIIRYNWIEGGNREIDLVDAEDSAQIREDPKYRKTFVYGNIIVQPQDIGTQIIHYGGDSGRTNWYRKGVLYFYNNTVVARRTDKTTLFRVQTNDEKVDCRNNIVYWTASGRSLAIVDSVGEVDMRNNWFKSGWVECHDKMDGTITEKHDLKGDEPGFVDFEKDRFYLAAGSPCINAGTDLSEDVPADLLVDQEYVPPQHSRVRSGSKDLGAFGFER